ncbi:Inner membrane protein YabI [Buchnera aphidicola (Tuberolachnus salignus)]|uniref:Inner membrane protein YabI n=1 Tax=Buchnera aphidicola subsp. Tuberolachnus salignus TaxID=98804 RepID=A0A160SWS7_BUCTT|nr:DedA family protein [Buchnera aphidicola]CUR53078.1 Inner membrane protein YabI [Buchnera aphidicola (Tuberolachnus salignus)]
MKYYLAHYMNFILNHLPFIVFIISFLESTLFIGLFIPGLVCMSTLGTFIGHEKINFYHAWFLSFIGCYLGDLISYFIGKIGQKKIKNMNFIQKKKKIIKKIYKYLFQYSFFTIFFGKFIGPIRPLIPVISGIFNISTKNFFIPNFFACICWPIIYFLPGILTALTSNSMQRIPNSNFFLFFITFFLCTFFLFIYILFNWIIFFKTQKKFHIFKFKISIKNGFLLLLIIILIMVFQIFFLLSQPQTILCYKLFKHLILKKNFF